MLGLIFRKLTMPDSFELIERLERLGVVLSLWASPNASLSLSAFKARYCAFAQSDAFLLCYGCKDADYGLLKNPCGIEVLLRK